MRDFLKPDLVLARPRTRDWYLVVAAVLVANVLRGFDYISGIDDPGCEALQRYAFIEDIWSIQWWGVSFLFGVASIVVGMLLRRHTPVWLGHGVLASVHVLLLVAVLISAPFIIETVRYVSTLVVVVIVHTVTLLRMGASPAHPPRRSADT